MNLSDIFQSLSLTPEAKIEATMQHEITRLTAENLVSSPCEHLSYYAWDLLKLWVVKEIPQS